MKLQHVVLVVVAIVGAASAGVMMQAHGNIIDGQSTPTDTQEVEQPNMTKVVMEDTAVASFTQRGPDGTVEFEKQTDGNWKVNVTVEEWNDYEMLLVYAYNAPYSEEYYLHPGDNTVTLRDVPNSSFVDLHVPAQERYGQGYIWEEEYWLDRTINGNQTIEFESDILITAVDQNISTEAEQNRTVSE